MEVLYLTIPLSAVLVGIFVGGFLYHMFRASGDPLRDSLLPFRKEHTTDHPSPKGNPPFQKS